MSKDELLEKLRALSERWDTVAVHAAHVYDSAARASSYAGALRSDAAAHDLRDIIRATEAEPESAEGSSAELRKDTRPSCGCSLSQYFDHPRGVSGCDWHPLAIQSHNRLLDASFTQHEVDALRAMIRSKAQEHRPKVIDPVAASAAVREQSDDAAILAARAALAATEGR